MTDQIPGATIRAFVDGELPADENARVQAAAETSAALQSAIDFERGLRDRVTRSMAVSDLPADLESRVRAAIDEPTEPEVVRRPWFAGPARANALAVAASIALVAGAVLFGVLGKPIDAIRRTAEQGLGGAVAAHVSSEHRRCAATDDARSKKSIWTTEAAAAIGLTSHLGVAVAVPRWRTSASSSSVAPHVRSRAPHPPDTSSTPATSRPPTGARPSRSASSSSPRRRRPSWASRATIRGPGGP